jgi:hypothetical protein
MPRTAWNQIGCPTDGPWKRSHPLVICWSSVVDRRRRGRDAYTWARQQRRLLGWPRRLVHVAHVLDPRIRREWYDVQVAGVVLGLVVLITLALEAHV